MAIELFTYSDAVEHLRDVFDFTDTSRLGRNARRAVDNVYREFPNMTRWTYYVRRQTLATSASQSSSTVTYDHTGGSSERMVTLASGTWPSWARFGVIRLDSVDYRVATRVSDTVLTLFEEDNPGDDLAAGTTYELSRAAYPLPLDFRRLLTLVDVDQSLQTPLISPQEWQRRRALLHDNPGVPWAATIMGDGDYYGALQLAFEPPPSTVRSFDMLYEAKPRDINIVSYATGTVSTSSTTVTGSGTTFPTDCVGSIIRFGVSASSTAVTNKYGTNPFTEQRVITARGGATNLTVDVAPTSAYSAGTAFSISDPIDMENVAMRTAFLRMIEAEYAKLTQLKDWAERFALAQQACRIATGNDRRDTAAQPAGDILRRWRDLPVTTD